MEEVAPKMLMMDNIIIIRIFTTIIFRKDAFGSLHGLSKTHGTCGGKIIWKISFCKLSEPFPSTT